MGKRYIDCSLNIVSADAWAQFSRGIMAEGFPQPRITVEPITTVKEHGVYVARLLLSTQCYTHIETSAHHKEEGRTIEQVPIEWFFSEGVVIDMMHKKPGQKVTGEELEKFGAHVRKGDIIIIRTGYTERGFGTRDFWANMIALDVSAADWILSKKPRGIMQDFMAEIAPVRTCECCGRLVPTPQFLKTPSICHHKFEDADMLIIEWCTNLSAITKPRGQVIALPLKIKGVEGSPARVIVVEED